MNYIKLLSSAFIISIMLAISITAFAADIETLLKDGKTAIENGKYYITNNELYTTPDGGTKMMVKITKLTQDSLVFDMNRGGQAETLTLLRN